MAIPGVYPQSRPLQGAHKSNFVAGRDGGVQIHIDGDKIRLGSEKADAALALAQKANDNFEKIRSAFQLHSHTYHKTPTTTQIGELGDVSCKKVVAE